MKIDCKPLFDMINEIESGESRTSRNWSDNNREARFAERVKAYDKMFYRYLDNEGWVNG